MRSLVLLGLLLLAPPVGAADDPVAVVPWFTGAQIRDSQRLPEPANPPPAARGTAGNGIELRRPIPLDNPLLQRSSGCLGFWIRPNWNGNDGQTHRILRIGDPESNGLLLEKAATGMLRFVMASPERATASRADVSHWQPGQWHHVVIAWFSNDGQPIGLPLWIDREAVAGPIAGGNTFLDPESLPDRRVWIGDESADAVMDELIMRSRMNAEGGDGLRAVVYRDYFRTAPYTEIKITPEALRVPSDRRVVAGHEKQFGLLATLGDGFEYVTDYAVRYGQWSSFDAKPFITWKTSDEKTATVDENGMVTGQAAGNCRLVAEFRGMTATYDIEVIPVEQPDLVLHYVERLPRYLVKSLKNMPAPGETVESVVHIENFGFREVPRGAVVRFELLPDADRDFRLDPDQGPSLVEEQTVEEALPPRATHTVSFTWDWPAEPVWVRVTLDPEDGIPEICEANNQRCELNIARSMRWGYEAKRLDGWYKERRINHVGSFCHYDWINAQCDRFNLILRESAGPTTTPHGIEDALRSDDFYEMLGGKWQDEPWVKAQKWHDGGFPTREPVNAMAIDAAILHEYGHTCVALPDLYGYPVRVSGVLLKDENGQDYAGSELLPNIRHDLLSLPSGADVPCGVGYTPLMNGVHLWLHPAHAGQVQHFRGYRGQRFWGVQGRLIPTREHVLQIFDIEDQPLSGAAVYAYHAAQTKSRDASAKYFADRPKFMGHTDEEGCFRFPNKTDKDWDDPETDVVEGEHPVWNPFGGAIREKDWPFFDVAFTPNVWRVEGLLLLKIVSGDQTEFAWLCLTDLNEAFFRGERARGIYPVRTSLRPAPKRTSLVRREIPEAIRERNLRPVAVVNEMEITVKVGEAFRLDGSDSHDPEGQPLIYRWQLRGRGITPGHGFESVLEGVAPKKPGKFKYVFYVIDGLRPSEAVEVSINVVDE